MRTVHRDIVGGFIFSNDGYILLGKTGRGGSYSGYYVVPGGGVDKHETKLEALKRELLEELGIDITEAKVELIKEIQTGQSEKTLVDTGERVLVDMDFCDFIINFAQPAAKIKVTPGDDLAEAEWIPLDKLSDISMTDPMKHTLRNLGYL